ncbi:MAG: hypothetical protein WC689_10935 [Methylocystis sp.]|jgi:hypothetical protein
MDLEKIGDLIKTAISSGGVYKLGLALACGVYWYLAEKDIIPFAESWEIRAAAAGALLFGFLWGAGTVGAFFDFFQPRVWIIHWVQERRERAHVRDYISHMTEKEREIIGYLLAKNQKVFTAAMDGGHAMPLLSQRIVIKALQPGQNFDSENTPMVIPDHIWGVLQAHKDFFPYKSPVDEVETHPWRVHWMER